MMSEKRFSETERNCYYTSLVFDNQTQEELGTNKVVDLLNELAEENRRLRKKIFDGFFYNCTLENENDISHLQYIFTLCKMLVDDAMEEAENEDMEFALKLAEESIWQFESRMKHFNQDKNGEKRVF